MNANDVPATIKPALTHSESFLGMGSPWIPNIEAEWLGMIDHEILLRDSQSGGYVRRRFADYHKVFGGSDHILTLAQCAEIPSGHWKWNALNISRSGFEKKHDKTRHDKTISLSLAL